MWTDEDILKVIKVADMLWEYRIKAKIKELDTSSAQFTIDVLKELLGDEKNGL